MSSSTATLDSFVKSSRPLPQALATSQEIRDRKSTFVGTAYRAATPSQARSLINHHRHVVHGAKPASHEVAAWRCMVLKEGRSGLEGPEDFEVKSGHEDDGEKYGGAKILKVMQTEGVLDVVIIVSRWFGGIMLGPARFDHIDTCARDVCRVFKLKQDMEECIAILTSLDEELSSLRSKLAECPSSGPSMSDERRLPETESNYQVFTSPQPNSSQSPQAGNSQITKQKEPDKPDYTSLSSSSDVAKARRLINARENAIKSLKTIIAKKAQKS